MHPATKIQSAQCHCVLKREHEAGRVWSQAEATKRGVTLGSHGLTKAGMEVSLPTLTWQEFPRTGLRAASVRS